MLEGSGGNVAVLTGPDGKVLVDAGIGVSRPQMTKALADLGADPITHLINTHWHFDHTDGNAWLNSVGAKIIAQENTRRYLSQVQRVEDWDYNFLSPPASGFPSEVFASERALKLNGQSINLKHYSPAHTDSDISVTFAEADVVHVADTFWNGVYPFIDYSTGGSIDGMIAASDANLAATTDKTIIIPGHGQPVSNKAELKEFRDMLVGDPGKRRGAQEAGQIARRDGRGETDCRLRRQVRQLRSSIPAFSPGWSTKACDRGAAGRLATIRSRVLPHPKGNSRMGDRYADIAFTETVKSVQKDMGSRSFTPAPVGGRTKMPGSGRARSSSSPSAMAFMSPQFLNPAGRMCSSEADR